MPITTEKAQITSQHDGHAYMNICHADDTGVMVWGTQVLPLLLSLKGDFFELASFEDEESLNTWLVGKQDKRNFRIMDDSIYELVEGEQLEMIAVSEAAQLNIQKIQRVFPDCNESQIIERALEMMVAYWRKN